MSTVGSVTTISVSLRRLLIRRPWIQWMLIAAVAFGIAASVHLRLRQVDLARDVWGATVPVLMATGRIEVGEPLRVEMRNLPIAVVPKGAITDATDLVARQRIGEGEIVTRPRCRRRRWPPGDDPRRLARSADRRVAELGCFGGRPGPSRQRWTRREFASPRGRSVRRRHHARRAGARGSAGPGRRRRRIADPAARTMIRGGVHGRLSASRQPPPPAR